MNRSVELRILPVAVVFLSSISFSQPLFVPAITTTICELSRAPEQFDGKQVEVHTGIRPGVEDSPTVLLDRSCSAVVVALITPKSQHYLKTKPYRALRHHLKSHHEVEATVTGIFQRRVVLFGNGATLDLCLVLQAVADVRKRSKPD